MNLKTLTLKASTVLLSSSCIFSASHCFADNPIVSHVYTADPAARVFNGRVYVMTSHDGDNQSGYDMFDYTLFSSDDMVNWQDHGIVFNVNSNTSWANRAYAPDIIERNGKYYLYFPNGASSIGVAVADQPEGPYTDALGRPLIDRNISNGNVSWVFDPGVFIDDDGQAYLYYGGGSSGDNARVIRLNNDMISTSGAAITINAPDFFEAAYMAKKNGIYYFSYSTTPGTGMTVDYLTSGSPTSGFQYRGTVLANPWENNYNNNHASMIEYQGQWYVFYHNRAVSNDRGAGLYQRSINVDRMNFNADGTIQQVSNGAGGVAQLKNVNAFARNEAETFDREQGIETEKASEGTLNLMMGNGDWIKVSGVDFGSGATGIALRVAAETPSEMEIILDNLNNSPIVSASIASTGGWQTWQTQSVSFSSINGVHDVYLRGTGYHNLDWYQFTGGSTSSSSSSSSNSSSSSSSGGEPNQITVELESLSSQSNFSPFIVQSDPEASGGQYIVWPDSGNQLLNEAADSASGQVTIAFNLSQASDLSVSMLANFSNAANDSFYYQLDSAGWSTQNNQTTAGWQALSPITFSNLTAGNHRLKVLRREDGAALDRVDIAASNGSITLTSSSSNSSSSTSSSSTSSSSTSGGINNCSGVNVYPNWPARDSEYGEYNHANAGDSMVHQNSLYRANWYTTSVPGSDASWSLLGACN
ncbi:MAG: family 43 glycosylhydrolase [Cellvibrionaceae bacterium]|nr:family 43 glycosylhydrolase [Cellvibrionaceae bacterium]